MSESEADSSRDPSGSSDPFRPVPCLRVTVDEARAEELSWRLEELRATAIETRDPGTLTAEQPGRVLMLAGFRDAMSRDRAREEIARLHDTVEVVALEVGDDGWSAGWRSFHQPVVLRRVEVLAPWMRPTSHGKIPIVIDPGRAFGTGGHATTRLVLEMIEQRFAERGPAAALIDVGTGSGVLAIAAVRLGAVRALAIDSDPEAVEAARENSVRNGVDEMIELRLATPRDVTGSYPLALANIDLKTFQGCAVDIAGLVSCDGEILVSGLLADQLASCVAYWPGFEVVEQRTRDGWAAAALRRER